MGEFINVILISSNRVNGKSANISWGKNKYTDSGFTLNYATFIDNDLAQHSDSTFNNKKENETEDYFYYVLGVIILIASGIIFKQRYEQYLKGKDNYLK